MPVRSTQLAVAVIADTSSHLVYTVPADKRTIVKSIVFFNAYTTAVNRMIAEFVTGSAHSYITAWPAAGGNAGETVVVPCWVVLDDGDEIYVQLTHASGTFHISGAELG